MKMNIVFFHFEEIIKRGYTLDMLFLLKLIEEDVDIKSLCEGSARLEALYQGVYRKGLITIDDKLTLTGQDLIAFLDRKETSDSKLVRKKNIDNEFDSWWKNYPGTDTFVYSGKTFSGTRSMRVKKDDCKIQLYKILDQGEYTIAELIAALVYETEQKKSNSVKSGSNKLTFMQNSLTYLTQRTFEPYIELVREGVKQVEEPIITGSTDI